jgi:hypothetical protein
MVRPATKLDASATQPKRDRDCGCFGDYKLRLVALRRRRQSLVVRRRIDDLMRRSEAAWGEKTRRWLEHWLEQQPRS